MYKIISDYGYGDRSEIEVGLTEEEVITWFVNNRYYERYNFYGEEIKLSDLPDDSSFIYYYREE